MYNDESITEIKLTEVTHCDLETKSILKPPKARAPLQEVDLGNQITVEFDVIRKRRVSFAGVNKVKEFNSEAKSFCIYNTPAYEEKVSTSSDSSALSSSVSGHINSWTKENDITILDDTMELTDLSIVQPSCAMDITVTKSQSPLQGAADTRAASNQGLAFLGGQFSTGTVIFPQNNKDNEKCGAVADPLQFFNRPGPGRPSIAPSVSDPTKVLLNELLEESGVDFPVDKYLKANSVFVQSNYPATSTADRQALGEYRYSLSCVKKASEPSEIAVAEAARHSVLPFSVNSGALEPQEKIIKFCPGDQKVVRSSHENLFGSNDPGLTKSCMIEGFGGNTLQMELTEAIPPHKIQLLQNQDPIREEFKSLRGHNASNMEFTEAIPPHKIQALLNQDPIREEFISLRSQTTSQMEFTEAIPPHKFQALQNQDPFREEFKSHRGQSISQMEFTEAIPPHKIQALMNQDPIREEFKSFRGHNTSNMEFTEAIPPHKIQALLNQNPIREEFKSLNTSHMEFTEAIPPHKIQALQNQNPIREEFKSLTALNTSHMEFTEAIPPHKIQALQNQNPIREEFKSLTALNTSHMEFTEAIPPHKIQALLNLDPIREEFISLRSQTTSQMEFTEAIPPHKIQALQNQNVIREEFKLLNQNPIREEFKSLNTSHMEFTEAIPPHKLQALLNQNPIREELKSFRGLSSSHMEFTEAIPRQYTHSIENVMGHKCSGLLGNGFNDSQMVFTQDLPSKNIQGMANNIQQENLFINKGSITFRKNETRNTGSSGMEFTGLPMHNLLIKSNHTKLEEITEIHSNPMPPDHALGKQCLPINESCAMDLSICSRVVDRNTFKNPEIIDFESDKQLKKLEGNAAEYQNMEKSHMEFTEALPAWNPVGGSSTLVAPRYGDNMCPKRGVTEIENLHPLQLDFNDSKSMDETDLNLTQAIPCDNKHVTDFELPQKNDSEKVSVFEVKKQIILDVTTQGNASQMEFTEAFPWKGIQRDVCETKFEKSTSKNEIVKELKCGTDSNVNRTSGSSSFMEFTEALPAHKQWGMHSRDELSETNATNPAVKNISSHDKNPNVIKTVLKAFDKTYIKERALHGDGVVPKDVKLEKLSTVCKEEENINNQSVILQKNTKSRLFQEHPVSTMEFTEAFPSRNIQRAQAKTKEGSSNPSSYVATRKSSVLPTNNCSLETSSMEPKKYFIHTEQASPQFRKELFGGDIVENENIHPVKEYDMNDSCSMDVTEIDNKLDNDILDKVKERNITASRDVSDGVFRRGPENINSVCLVSSDFSKNVIRPKKPDEMQPDVSEIEFAKSLHCRNIEAIESKFDVNNFSNDSTVFKAGRKSVMLRSNGNIESESVEKSPPKEVKQLSSIYITEEHGTSPGVKPRNEDIPNESNPIQQGNLNNSLPMGISRIDDFNVIKHIDTQQQNDAIAKRIVNDQFTGSSSQHVIQDSCQLNEKPKTDLSRPSKDLKHQNMTALFESNGSFGVKNVPSICIQNSGMDSTQMEFTEAVLPSQLPLKTSDFVEKQGKVTTFVPSIDRSLNLSGENSHGNSQMEFTKAVLPAQTNYLFEAQDKVMTAVSSIDGSLNLNSENEIRKLPETSQIELTGGDAMQINHRYSKNFSDQCTNFIKEDMKEDCLQQGNLSSSLSMDMSGIDDANDLKERDNQRQNDAIAKTIVNNQFINNLKLDEKHYVNDYQTIPREVESEQTDGKLWGEKTEYCNRAKVNSQNKTNSLSNVLSLEDSFSKMKMEDDTPLVKSENSLVEVNFKNEHVAFLPINNLTESNPSNFTFDIKSVGSDKNIAGHDVKKVNQNNVDTIPEFPSEVRLEKENSNHACQSVVINSVETYSTENASHQRGLAIEHGPTGNDRKSSDSGIFETNDSPDCLLPKRKSVSLKQASITDGLSNCNEASKDSVAHSTDLEKERDNEIIMESVFKDDLDTNKVLDSAVEKSYHDHKKNLVHFNTPPVRINKKRKTIGPSDFDRSKKLSEISSMDVCFPDTDARDLMVSQKRIFEEEKTLNFDLEKGNEEWERLVKNDSFMKKYSFEFVSPVRWKYKFKWPLELVLEIPDVEVKENTRKKNISLVSKISNSDPISAFVDNRMKRVMSVILTEKWLNSHCKTIHDLLLTIKFIEEEYIKLDPLICSMKYFYREFPFDFIHDRIVFTIVNLRKEYCFEVNINVSCGQVKGKHIDVINHVGQISKNKVQHFFDQLLPNTERFFLFWQKLKNAYELQFFE